jgi:outer membrane protein TolC
VRRGDLELVKTRNGLLPRLDLFVRLGDTGYARSVEKAAGDLDGRDPAFSVGVQLEFPLMNREARALHTRAELTREQTDTALANMEDLARVDVESAFIETLRTREQIAATGITRQFQEEKLRAEQAKFRVGRSTSLLVAQAQKDLVNSQVSEVESVTASLQSLVRLYRLEGSLLERRGLEAPGARASDQ